MLHSLFGDTWVYMPSAREIFEAFIDLNLTEKSFLSATLLWLVILFLPLKGIDHREFTTAMTYVLFLVSSGVILGASAPSRLLDKQEYGKTLILMGILSAITCTRWTVFYLRSSRSNEINTKDKKNESK